MNKNRFFFKQVCKPYGHIADDLTKDPTFICGGQKRQETILTSSKTQVNVSFNTDKNGEQHQFMLYYEGIKYSITNHN